MDLHHHSSHSSHLASSLLNSVRRESTHFAVAATSQDEVGRAIRIVSYRIFVRSIQYTQYKFTDIN